MGQITYKSIVGGGQRSHSLGDFFAAQKTFVCIKNPAYGRHRISRPMRIVGPIKFWRVYVIYLEKKNKWAVDASTRPLIRASARPHDGSRRGRWTLCTNPPLLGPHACNKMGSTPVLPRKIRQNQHTKKKLKI